MWQISINSPDGKLTFVWTMPAEADGAQVTVSDEQGEVLLSQGTTEGRIELNPQDYAQGTCTLRVEVRSGETSLACEELRFTLVQGNPGGGRPSGGGFGGGSRGSGGSGGAGMEGEVEQGFRVTPGQALTSSHASGSRDMQLYGTVALEASDAEMTRLTLGETELNLTLDGGAAFTASLNDSMLYLQPVSSGEHWGINLSALETLNRSGIETLSLVLEGDRIELSTALELCGGVYASLRSQGCVAKDFLLEVESRQLYIAVNGARYRLTGSGELASD